MRLASRLVVPVLTLALLGVGAACNRVTAADQACLDTVDAVSDAWERCGYDRDTKHTELLARYRSCDRVDHIRDETELRDQCFPALATLDCTALVQELYPDPCLEQILF